MTDTNQKEVAQSPWRNLWHRYGVHIAVVIFFTILSLAYFSPATFEGRELFQQDVAGASGTAQDVRNHEAETGERSYWTNSLFGGMPMYQISPSYPSTELLQKAQNIGTMRSPFDLMGTYAWLLFAMMVGFYIFMQSLRQKVIPSVIGALLWTFSSYFLILIIAGHIWKLTALCFIPPTIAGMIWCYRGEYLKGGFVAALFTALQVLANHVQMSYYFLFVMGAFFVAFLVEAIKQKQLKRFGLASLTLVGAGLLGVAINLTNLYHTYQYSKETMRGGSELTLRQVDGSNRAEHENKNGLDKAYITQWSYGKGETWSLLIPNIKGGASGYLGNSEQVEQIINQEVRQPDLRQYVASQNQYWGDQPFTAGPVYVGAFVMALFILGCVRVKGPIKWVLLTTTILSILLSWGHNLMWLSDLFIDYFPMYNKFRTVSSILVIAEFSIPALAIMGLVELMRHPQETVRDKWAMGLSLGLTAGAALLFALMPSMFFDFLSQNEQNAFAEAMVQNPQVYGELIDGLVAVRTSIFRSDAWRSFAVIVLSIIPIALYVYRKLPALPTLILVGLISLVDLWTVDKRYLNDEHFISSHEVHKQAAPKTEADEQILMDKSQGYRVLNLSVNTFNDATTSRWHHSIGGYHPAKLQRYQDLIDYQLVKRNPNVLAMLNTKYVIIPEEKAGVIAFPNPTTYGPAWIVNEILWVDDANAEMRALDSTDLRHIAVIDKRFASTALRSLSAHNDSTARISLKGHTPNRLVYETESKVASLAVLSEIYYPHGWEATVDGKPVEIARANYVLRAIPLPAGKHTLELRFAPHSIRNTERIATVALFLLIALALALIIKPFVHRKRNDRFKAGLFSAKNSERLNE